MARKLFALILLLTSLASFAQQNEDDPQGECAFCQSEILERQKFYEDDLVIALCTHKPIEPCHLLIIPKRHVERYEALTEEELIQICRVIKKVHRAATLVFETNSYLLHQKNGKEVGQTVPHVHFHYIARKDGDDSSLKFAVKLLYAQMRGPISEEEMRKKVEALLSAIQLQNRMGT